MAFRPLTDAECGQANPLVKLTTHLTRDHTFAETHGQLFQSSSDQLVEQFLQETRAVPQSFRMDDLFREMHEIESQRNALPPVPASAIKDQLNDNTWAQQYLEDGKHFAINHNHEEVWAEINGHPMNLQEIEPIQSFDHIWNSDLLEPSNNKVIIEDVTEEKDRDETSDESKFMKFMQRLGEGDGQTDDSELGAAWGEEYLRAAAKEDPTLLAENWAREHTNTHEGDYSPSTEAAFWTKLQSEWSKLAEADYLSPSSTEDHPWLGEYQDYYDPYKDYAFNDSNPMFDLNDALARGKELRTQGDLPAAVLCFEAAVKKDGENGEAWELLGITQAENEQDPNAICALKRCLEIMPDNRAALMALAVSYTNESYQHQACTALVQWLRSHPAYAGLVPADLKLSGDQLRQVQDLYIRAAQMKPQDIDLEVQCGLGVLFNCSGEYDKAADCFRSALTVAPEDARLWNRLGATLANGTKPEEAVDAYHRALNIEPGFIRARYNVGITCINLSAHKEAAEHFLLALNQQARGSDVGAAAAAVGAGANTASQMSESIWSTLRMCVSLMSRPDLRAMVDARDLPSLSAEFQLNDNS